MVRPKQSIQSHRKDEHVFLAEKFHQDDRQNDFDGLRFIHQSLPELAIADVDISTQFAGTTWQSPFYINGMTGGSQQTKKLNAQLAQVAQIAGLPMATGSQSVAIKNPTLVDTFSVIREFNPAGFILANIGAGNNLSVAQKAVAMTQANALEIHVNTAQEVVMPEGDREFYWLDQIGEIVANLDVPVIVKEVGFGMSAETIAKLQSVGVTNIDVSGKGGTNFVTIENERRRDKAYDYLSDWGQSTVESLFESQAFQNELTILASGGIRNPLDIVKALRLGASAVGISGQILHMLIKTGPTETAEQLLAWQAQIQSIMAMLGARNLTALQSAPMILSPNLRHYLNERHLSL
ncbi:type 2 isopentenyl-diphosphate Delta-isomerase [Latilactobacillus sakei]|uniref:type 2 isopentenyl-diphosphate Delta-isomerase n=1 Tax=Latilactobacillus sakei TaxID=1599 RepID=UPI0035C76253